MNRKSLLAIVTALGLGTAAGSAFAYDSSDVRAMEQAKITLEQAIEKAQQLHAGSRALSAEIEVNNGRAEYEVEVLLSDKRVYDVHIDAQSGEVVMNREDRDD